MPKDSSPEGQTETRQGEAQQGGGQAAANVAGTDHPTNPVQALRDPTLQDPHCVFQIVKRHFARYTPEMVSEICGCSVEAFLAVAEAVTANSGRERTTAFCYA